MNQAQIDHLLLMVIDGRLARLEDRLASIEARRPLQATDNGRAWPAEASADTEASDFDHGYARQSDYFADGQHVARARVAICGEWDPQRVGPIMRALERYANMMTSQKAAGRDLVESHKMALEVSRQVYRIGMFVPDDPIG